VPDAPAVPLVRFDAARALGAEVAVTPRVGGVSAPPYDTLNLAFHVGDRPEDVAQNRARAASSFGVRVSDMVFARQEHGATATLVGAGDRGRGSLGEDDAIPGTDILVTATTGVTLVILVADCLPLALVDPDAGVLATVHAGWRGTAGGAVAAALGAMGELGARPDRVHAFLGPAVPPERYQVSDDVHRALAGALPVGLDSAVARPDGPGHWLVDLVAANRQQLRLAGVRDAHVVTCGRSTADEGFFSHRASRPCGRFALLARLTG